MKTPQRTTTRCDRMHNLAAAFDRYFPGCGSYNPGSAMELPWKERPFFRVEYHDIYELNAVRSIAPSYCRVEYVFVAPLARGATPSPTRHP